MKISKADFEQMKAKYDQEVKKGKPAKGKKGDIVDQTDWIFFDRKTLEEILADPNAGGIKFYFTEYTEEVAKKLHPENPDEYVGRINLVMTASVDGQGEILDASGDSSYYNRGKLCPPTCE
ncbi:molecular chaperone DnaK [Algoriphagus lacus]|uniref:Molecular chaperone DnaK n=1 Tax=Algoriphagus lacus TaxID=2056311 RepID=A0A418PWT4_9BACT|nr:molecular chaperone DnaK [Algoriphagus lacus]RIW18526.1 molecular chaperone DnaK [Algoriphagus lacus]